MNDLPPKDHNQDPFTESQNRADEIIKTANEWVTKCPEIQSEDQAGRANDFRNQIRAAKKKNEETRKSETDPLTQQAKAIKAKYDALNPFLDECFSRLGKLVEPWLDKLDKAKKEEERLAREEADRLRREAAEKLKKAEEGEGRTIQAAVEATQAQEAAVVAEKAADNIAKEKVQVRGDLSDKATGFRTTWSAALIDPEKAFAYYKDNLKLIALLESLASADARGGRRRIPGFDVTSTRTIS